ncbi:MAG: hypothetical protein COS84_00385 [Armatimonadetes bacterium CG07_land_8_20_14_0_80_40_9]|nr:MAG: hypothetical protein COS84_00385 [Armatimonadetes bacterium CG07_land_8_20_14_0_80_40_9]
MTIKVKYENGILVPLKKINWVEKEIYEIEIHRNEIRKLSPSKIDPLCGIAKVGGNALRDTEKLYE